MTARRIAVNPIPYWSRAGKTRQAFEEAFRDFQEIGFTAVKADVPDGMSPEESHRISFEWAQRGLPARIGG